jgi:L-iditol 2-dehydrogenase
MKAAVWHGERNIVIENLPKPVANQYEVVIRVKAAGICGSELHAYEGLSKRRTPPLVMGHEFAGIVEEIGKGVNRIKVGDRVTMEPAVPCGSCEACLTGRSNLCKARRHIGLDFQGAFAEYVKAPSLTLHKIPDPISFEEATLAEPLSAGLHAVSIAKVGGGDTILIIGAGVIGISCLIAARDKAKSVIISDVVKSRLEFARPLGADVMIDSSKIDPIDEVERFTNGRGVDAVIEAVGLETTVAQAISAVREGGRVTVIGLLDETIRFNIMKIVTREIQLSGSYGRTSEDFRNSLALLERRAPTIRGLITHKLPLEKASEGFETLSKQKHTSMKVILIP